MMQIKRTKFTCWMRDPNIGRLERGNWGGLFSSPVLCHPSTVPLGSSSLWGKSCETLLCIPEDPPSNLPALEGELEAEVGEGNLRLLSDQNPHFLCVLRLVAYSGLSDEKKAYQDGDEDGGLYDPPQ